MFIPLGHENMHGRRWPVITIGIIALNFVIFFGTHSTIDQQAPELGAVKMQILLLAAIHPELKMSDKVQQFVSTVQKKSPALWKEAQKPYWDMPNHTNEKIRLQQFPETLQYEMDSLSDRYAKLDSASILTKYAYTPAQPKILSLLTANFLHAGWLHLIGNMWFLWLAGAILEDTWGRLIYPAFFMIAGVLALVVHGTVNAGSFVPTIGASGAIAGLMGAFLVRFPTTKIEMGGLVMYRIVRYKVRAYWALPFWLLLEIFYGTAQGGTSGVAHWAHVGGFVFGGLIAYGVRASGLEQIAEKHIQDKITWVSNPLMVEAGEQIDKGQFDAAISTLKKLLLETPDSIDAYRMLKNIYWRKNDLPAYRGAQEKQIELETKSHDPEGAWQTYQDFTNSGGEKLSAPVWLNLCRQIETQPDQERAVGAYVELAKAYPGEKQGLLAQMAAGRIYLRRLNRPADAITFYEAAQASPVPHHEWQATIEHGIAEAKKAPQTQPAPVDPG